jgi:hypothetical protein
LFNALTRPNEKIPNRREGHAALTVLVASLLETTASGRSTDDRESSFPGGSKIHLGHLGFTICKLNSRASPEFACVATSADFMDYRTVSTLAKRSIALQIYRGV